MAVHQQCTGSYSNFSGRHVAKGAAIEDEAMIFAPAAGAGPQVTPKLRRLSLLSIRLFAGSSYWSLRFSNRVEKRSLGEIIQCLPR